ncbi:hypothetical protein LCGC14_1842220 [marine sediment metagenome]|uniref:Uncharacterized protein n=1 Tax=marine sediment metagenome TaxID=412755 RepID=A0A0F9JC59_9ZZZZ
MRPRRLDTHRKGYKSHAFTEVEDARILELRARGFNRSRVSKALDVAYYAVSTRVTMLETLASEPNSRVRVCIRPGCTTEFVSEWSGHRVCNGCRVSEESSEPFGNFVVMM